MISLLSLQKGPTTIIVEPTTGKDRPYTFDYSFWSHDAFHDVDGWSTPDAGSNYADQQEVYEALGKQVLDNAWAGFHCCLFAYGQTGSGKSYSMVCKNTEITTNRLFVLILSIYL